MKSTVYVVTNGNNGKKYVGVTRFTVEHRWSQHLYCANVRRLNTHLYHAIRKYGSDVFTVEEFVSVLDVRDSGMVEMTVIKDICPEYNQTGGGEHTYGKKYSKETVEKIREKNIGKKRSASCKEKISEIKKREWEIKTTEEKMKNLEILRLARLKVDHEKRISASIEAQRYLRESDPYYVKKNLEQLRTICGKGGSTKSLKKIEASFEKRKQVECVELGIIFESVTDAARYVGINISAISRVCLKKRKRAHGMHFNFV